MALLLQPQQKSLAANLATTELHSCGFATARKFTLQKNIQIRLELIMCTANSGKINLNFVNVAVKAKTIKLRIEIKITLPRTLS
jgi:hypothetical protein